MNSRFDARRIGPFALCVVVVLLGSIPAVSFGHPSEQPFEIIPGSFKFIPSTYQAGAHSDWTTTFDFAREGSRTFNDLKDTTVNLPAGFTASNTAVSTCTFAQLLGKIGGPAECPVSSQVGTVSFELDVSAPEKVKVPVFNMEVTSFGVTAELGFKSPGLTQVLPVSIRPGDDGITVTSPSIVELGEPHEIVFKVWGLPAASEHDPERGLECYSRGGVYGCENGGQEAKIPVKPFLSNPTSCGMFKASMSADSWEAPTVLSEAETETGPIVECERVPFDPSVEARPTTVSAESPSGLEVSLAVSQTWDNPDTIATSNVKDVKVTLPEGYTVNPAKGNGLVGCTPEQYAAETASSLPGVGCPGESRLGTVVIRTPVLGEAVEGSVYLAQPYENVSAFGSPEHPDGSLLALYVVAKAPDRGIIVKTAGKVEANPVTGQLTSTFQNLPAQPFSTVTFKLEQGATAPLASPPVCGRYVAQAVLTPFSAPEEPRLVTNELGIEHGIGGGPCPAGGTPPFKPTVVSGTQDNDAGNYTPFYLRIVRNDGEQEITKFTTILPPGLTANLTGIPFCSDAQIEMARHATGQQELTAPSCPAASEIGHTLVGAGVGETLAWTPGKVYLAGPYNGSALSIVSVTSATVGPFDLGTVVIRFALRINPTTGQAEIDGTGSDPIPHIIDGIVVHVRDIHVYVDRSKFMIAPTSCEPMSISNTITGAGADPANPADQQSLNITTPFQAADCSSLAFKPSFSVTTSGKTSKANGAGLTVKLAYPSAPQGTQANIHRVKVDLPKQLPSRLTTLQKACTEQAFDANPASCPAASVIGHARAITPILPVPLEGPAYFVSHGGAKFPELIMVLQGYGVTIDLHGETFISKQGVTSSTFAAVPDEPVTSFELTLPQGPDSALAANGNLCATKLSMPTEFVGQNGMTIHQSTSVTVTGCPKVKTLTRAQKLAAALKACHRKPRGAKRSSCERAARKKYGPPKRKKK
ncbi:MAG TPA: hypothetical protein VG053_07425 [Solirubrobacteraceae bacterium]|nr:hypothetical protein [Solirubrobacteraceae bacterium]